MIWGGGLLAGWSVLDFAGGIAVHTIAGMGAMASVVYLGKRRVTENAPHNVPFVALGAALLWFGWFGFNAGSELAVDKITILAFVNTQLSAAFAAVTWLVVDWRRSKKPSFVGFLTGALAGLVAVTPAAGFVGTGSAVIIGIVAGVICYGAVEWKNRMGWDDALDVWGVHGVGGIIGIVMLGLFASTSINPAGADGLLEGGGAFFGKQVIAVIGASVYAFIATYVILNVINMITPVLTDELSEENGVDASLHGEAAYV